MSHYHREDALLPEKQLQTVKKVKAYDPCVRDHFIIKTALSTGGLVLRNIHTPDIIHIFFVATRTPEGLPLDKIYTKWNENAFMKALTADALFW